MNGLPITLNGADLVALTTGALFWPSESLLAVADLHLGKSERMARRGGAFLPPYETRDTLIRLQSDIEALAPATVLCLGDTFDDDLAALALDDAETATLLRLQAGRRWIWITGNHDPAPLPWPGTQLGETRIGPLTFRHIADVQATGEVSGHYHPKANFTARGRGISRPCFLIDAARLILPAYGTYTGGLKTRDDALTTLMAPDARAVLTGPTQCVIPMPRR